MIKIEELKNTKNIKILAAVIGFLIICILVLLGCKNLIGKSIGLNKDIIKKTQELNKEKTTLAQQGPIKSELEKINAKILSIEKGFSSNIEEIFLQLNKFAVESGASLKTITPSDKKRVEIPGSKDSYIELPVTIRLQCGYRELVTFLRKLEGAKKIMAVVDIHIQPDQQNVWEHNIELIVNVPVSI
jgi:Tfp pilus assembly protein PilO